MSEPSTSPWVQAIKSRPRLIMALVIGFIAYFLGTSQFSLTPLERGLVAWDIAVGCYLIMITRMMRRSSPEEMRRRAIDEDAGRKTVLTLVIASVTTSFFGIGVELVEAKAMYASLKGGHVALALITVAISWVFAHLMFSQHYAYEYYEAILGGHPGGLEFPGEDAPGYTDFVYLSFTVGTSSQTSDVSISSRSMRRLATVHGVFSFVFNTALIALGINIASGLV